VTSLVTPLRNIIKIKICFRSKEKKKISDVVTWVKTTKSCCFRLL